MLVGSRGGYGGSGQDLLFSHVGAGNGGAGGSIVMEQKGALAGTAAPKDGGSLLKVYSQGGGGGGALYGFGGGGQAGNVNLIINTNVIAQGDRFAGVLAQSIGGAAGYGGASRSEAAVRPGGVGGLVKVEIRKDATVSTTGKNAPAVILESIGGQGGTRGNGSLTDDYVSDGGLAGKVEFKNFGTVHATGDFSAGILLQSVGGGGGNQSSSGGGTGGKGANGSVIDAAQWGTVVTKGAYTFGLLAQSLGGTGGAGGAANFFSGGDGGSAGAGGTVSLSNFGAIETHGAGSIAIVGQSVGGGNATSAFAMQGVPQPSGGGAGGRSGIFVSGGGDGGTGGDGGKVSITNGGQLVTNGEAAFGILAQSIGGGGGGGGRAVTFGPLVGFALGGRGGGGGNGGDVEILAPEAFLAFPEFLRGNPSITTTGARATGIVALSVGGSGGTGGSATAISATPIAAIAVAIGGNGGDGGAGGKVTVDNVSAITTSGIEALGIDAKSIGGGGGNAGNASAYALSVPYPGLPSISVTYTNGGTGGKGGSGKEVTVTNHSTISTTGAESKGIQATSVGGGGGSGGAASSTSDMLSNYLNVGVTVALGGAGGDGGHGSTVTVVNNGLIDTKGSFATGIFAQSIGGGGGSGGTANAIANAGISWQETLNDVVTKALPIADSLTVKRTVGGKGANAGNGGQVSLTNNGKIVTWGGNAPAVFAQSIGGGGGDAGGYMASGKGSFNVTSGVGGLAGGGGKGDLVQVTNTVRNVIETHGPGSIGLFAQSVGGGGGVGGMMAGSKKSAASTEDKGTANAIIQFADDLLKADKVFSEFLGSKEKNALEQYKLLDKNSDFQKKVGAASDVLKVIKVLLDEKKDLADKVIDIGGKAIAGTALDAFKDGVKNFYKSISDKPAVNLPSISLTQSVGGKGGKGGDGGDVTVVSDGAILTYDLGSWGIYAQSIGGGGGLGGAAAATGNNKMNITAVVGGDGSDGGKGGTVKVTNTGLISTLGGGSFGILAQSVGGGGGSGGGAASSNAVSIAVSSRVGGKGGNSSNSGNVTVTNSGTITTMGRESHAVIAQSVGGGGGLFFLSRYDPSDPANLATSQAEYEGVKASYDIMKDLGVNTGGTAQDTGVASPIPSLLLSLGGDGQNRPAGGAGGGGGDGGEVLIKHSGTISTAGLGAFGIFAQSIGGGGGVGADASNGGSEIAIKGEGGLGIIGGSGGVGGNGGRIDIRLGNNSSIVTGGSGAHGVFAQSIGGGGGYAGTGTFTNIALNSKEVLIKDAAASGNGGTIDIRTEGKDRASISTAGERAHGIYAQSIGGGGGTVFDTSGNAVPVNGKTRFGASGQGGAITIDLAGTITTTGADAYAIYAQSGKQKTDGTLDASKPGGLITVRFSGLLVGGGGGNGAAIKVDGGNGNLIEIVEGSIVRTNSATAILGTFAEDRLENYGSISGAINLASTGTSEKNTFNNHVSGFYEAIGAVNLGSGQLTNDGQMTVDKAGAIGRLNVTGNYNQTGTGVLFIDLGSLNRTSTLRSDRIDVTGDLKLGGTIKTNVVDGLKREDFEIATAKGAIATTATVLSGAAGSPFTWTLSSRGNSVYVTPGANFVGATDGTATDPEKKALGHFQSVWDTGQISTRAAEFFGELARSSSTADFMATVDSLSPEESQSTLGLQVLGARSSMHFSLSCPAFEGTGTLLQETDCVWARVIGTWTDQGTTSEVDSYNQSAVTYRIGAQKEILDNWFLGATAGLTQSWLNDSNGYSNTEGTGVDAAVSLKRQVGSWLFAVSGHLGFGSYNTERIIDVGPTLSVSSGTSSVLTAGARLRTAYEFVFPNWYVRPYADVDLLYTYMPSYQEQGTGTTLAFTSTEQWNIAFSPNVEFGARIDLSPDMWIRPYATAGMTFLAKDSIPAGVSYSDLSGAGSFITDTDIVMPATLLNLSVGAQLYGAKGYELRAEYRADIGNDFLAQELSARFSVPF